MSSLFQDLRYALRSLRRSPAFVATAVITLALGIGAGTAVFSIVDGVLLRPLPYREADRLVAVQGVFGSDRVTVSERERARYRETPNLFQRVGVYQQDYVNIGGAGAVERVPLALVDADLFPVLGTAPLVGRGFSAAEDAPGGPAAVVLSYGLWQRRFGGAVHVLGRSALVNGVARTVVGIMPEGFRLPTDFAGSGTDVFLPLALPRSPDPRNLHYLTAVARLAPGVSVASANARLQGISRDLRQEIATLPGEWFARATPLATVVTGPVKPALLALLGAVALMLLIACANVANLLLVRAERRTRELAVRTAMGAGRARLIRQLVVEGVVLGIGGGAVGLALAAGAVRALVVANPPNLPRVAGLSLDWRVLLVATVLSIATGALVGLIPALRAGWGDLHTLLREGTGRAGGGRRTAGRRALVVAETALAVTLAIGAGLLVRSFLRLQAVPTGFAEEHLLTLQLSLPESTYPDNATSRRFYSTLLERVRTLPGVRQAGITSHLPLASSPGDWGVRIAGREEERLPSGRHPYADWIVVSDGYCRALGVTLHEGRCFTAADQPSTVAVVVINDAMARAYWPGRSAIGQRFEMSSDIDTVYRTVVGVVSDIRQDGLEVKPSPTMYLPYSQFPASQPEPTSSSMSLVVRTGGAPLEQARAIRAEVAAIDPTVPVSAVRTMHDVRARSTAVPRLELVLFSVFGTLGLLLVAIGVYAVTAYSVAERTRELGIRVALGAEPARVRRMILGEGIARAAVGVVIGLASAALLSRLMASLLYGVGALDAVTFLAVPLVVGVVTLAACYVPARRATRVNPIEALRQE